MRHNGANKMTPYPCQMRNFQNFDKIDSFLKPVLNILILGNLIVGWGVGIIKKGAGILHQIYRFNGVLTVEGIWFIKARGSVI